MNTCIHFVFIFCIYREFVFILCSPIFEYTDLYSDFQKGYISFNDDGRVLYRTRTNIRMLLERIMLDVSFAFLVRMYTLTILHSRKNILFCADLENKSTYT